MTRKLLSRLTLGLWVVAAPLVLLGCGEEATPPATPPPSPPGAVAPGEPGKGPAPITTPAEEKKP
jgi:hypothetical protein